MGVFVDDVFGVVIVVAGVCVMTVVVGVVVFGVGIVGGTVV